MLPESSSRKSLDAIGRHFGSDKSSLVHGFLDNFEPHFERLRDTEFTLIEFGMGQASSIRIWLEYFSRAHVISVHPNPLADATDLSDNSRVTFVQANQNDVHGLEMLLDSPSPMIIIDDGRHYWRDQLASLTALYTSMPEGGLYIIEDTPTNAPEKSLQYSAGSDISPLQCVLRAAQALALACPVAIEPSAVRLTAIAGLLARLSKMLSFAKGYVMLTRNGEGTGDTLPARSVRDVADRFEAVETGGAYRRLPAELVDCPAWLTARFDANVRPGTEVAGLPGTVAWLHGATVHGRGVVTTHGRCLVRESLINAENDDTPSGFLKLEAGRLYANVLPNRIVSFLGGEPRVLLKQTWDGNYCHWLVESLPRVALVAQVTDLSGCRFIVQDETTQMRKVYLDTLSFFGIPEDRVDFTSFNSVVVETLIYPAPITRQPWVKAPCVIDLLERFPEKASEFVSRPANPQRIYVSRSGGYRRRLVNEPEIVDYLARRGFVTVTPEHLSFWEQVAVFAKAEIVVGLLGGGLSNLVFAPKGVTCIALATEFMGDDFFYDIICHKRGRYVSIHGKATDPGLGMNSDFTLPLSALAPYVP